MVRFGAVISFNEQPVTSPQLLAGFARAAEEAGRDPDVSSARRTLKRITREVIVRV